MKHFSSRADAVTQPGIIHLRLLHMSVSDSLNTLMTKMKLEGPILGNIADFPRAGEPEWEHWLKHKDTYGMQCKQL